MSTVQQAAPPNPVRIFQTLLGFQQSAALRAAIGFDLFTAIAEGHTDVASIAKKIGASEKGTRVLCDAMVIMEFLSKSGSSYGLVTESAVFLNKREPSYIGGAANFLVDDMQASGAYNDFTGAVKKGGSVFSDEGTVSYDNPIWVSFGVPDNDLYGQRGISSGRMPHFVNQLTKTQIQAIVDYERGL